MDMEPLNKEADQIALVVVTGGEEMRIPIVFDGEDSDLKTLYPYMLDMMHYEADSPYVKLQEELAIGRYADRPEEDILAMSKAAVKAGAYWCGKKKENVLAVALRIAADLRLRNIADIFPELSMALNEEEASFTESVIAEANRTRPMVDDLKVDYDPQEVDKILLAQGLTNATEKSFNPGEGSLVPGFGGSLAIKFYEDDEAEQAKTQEQLDKLDVSEELKQKFQERLQQVALGQEEFRFRYKPGEKFDESQIEHGLLGGERTAEEIYDELDRKDGLKSEDADVHAQEFMDAMMAEREGSAEDGTAVSQANDDAGDDLPDDDELPDGSDDVPAFEDNGDAPVSADSEDVTSVPFGSIDDEDDVDDDDYYSDDDPMDDDDYYGVGESPESQDSWRVDD